MSKYTTTPLNEEISFGENEIIVSKTDASGRLVYANDIFCRVAEMSTEEALNQPHSIIRHPDMPRAVFKLLWDTISAGQELFAYVKNMSKSGKYYWVIAHVTPSFDHSGNVIGYHSNRRKPTAKAVTQISSIYRRLLDEEKRHRNKKEGLDASFALFEKILKDTDKSYDEFIWEVGK